MTLKLPTAALAALFALCIALVSATPVQAHGGGKAEHGGILKTVGETTLELVTKPGLTEVWVEDEGDEVASEGLSAHLTIAVNGQKSEETLAPGGENRLWKKGLTIPKGAHVAVQVTMKDGVTKVGANFVVK